MMYRCSAASILLIFAVTSVSWALPVVVVRHDGEDHSADAPATSAPGAVAAPATSAPATAASTTQMAMGGASPGSTSPPQTSGSGGGPTTAPASGGGAAAAGSGSSNANPTSPASTVQPTSATSAPATKSAATGGGGGASSSSPGSTSNATSAGASSPGGGGGGAATATPNTTAGSTAASPSSAPSTSNNASSCFPADAQVTVFGGGTKRMDELVLGDRVFVGGGQPFSEVFMFTHQSADVAADFVVIDATVSGARLRVTPGHYLYVNGALTAAAAVVPGDAIELGDGTADTVAAVSSAVLQGLYNPQTLQGDIVVDGVRASTYTTAVAPVLAHAMLTPLRAAYRALRLSTDVISKNGFKLSSHLPSGGPSIC